MFRPVSTARTVGIAARLMLVFTVVLGLLYPLFVTGVGQLLFRSPADGSLVGDHSGRVVGSRLIGQTFSDKAGNPLPQYFQPRPSAAGDGYDPRASGGSNQGPESPELIAAIRERRHTIATFNGVPEAAVPADALTASGSGLDPDISPANAAIQVERVARVRGITAETVARLVSTHTQGPDVGYLGQPRVNVLELNVALDGLGL